jgi:hypothetical protein
MVVKHVLAVGILVDEPGYAVREFDAGDRLCRHGCSFLAGILSLLAG